MKTEEQIKIEIDRVCSAIEMYQAHMLTGKERTANSHQFNFAKERLKCLVWFLEGKYMTDKIKRLLR